MGRQTKQIGQSRRDGREKSLELSSETGESLICNVTTYARFNHVTPAGFSESESPTDINMAGLKSFLGYGPGAGGSES
jgi:hypothetical protein